MNREQIKALVGQLTLEEKAGLCSGRDNWYTKAVVRLGIPAVRTSDGPHGLRTQAGSLNSLAEDASIKAVCFPAGCAVAAGFDRELLREMGVELGRECQAAGVDVLLGPGINIKRSPLCGRNFEYYSEDPLVAGELGAAYVQGVQSQGRGTSLKHFFANSQEHRRMDCSSQMDERTMREIYLTAFETVVKEAQPWTVMASYNKIGSIHATAHKKYLTDMLRDEWGFQGLVTSDWGAVHDRVAAVEAGCDLTMPAEDTDAQLVAAVQEGRLSQSALDACCERVLELAFKAAQGRKEAAVFDYEGGHELARRIASECIVLLKNEMPGKCILPLSPADSVAFIGGFAAKPRYQGGGSSHINSFKVVSALEAARNAGYCVTWAQGYPEKGTAPDAQLIAEAVRIAKEADVAVVFAGLPDNMESEGVDRRHMNMPESHNALIEAVCAANPDCVVVLHNGAPVEMPWVDRPRAIVEAYLGGQAVGEAVVDILFGHTNPSGHLPETFPKKLSDNPSYLFYFGEGDRVDYSERFFVGYRYYVSKDMEPLYPFGHGLSYTTFEYGTPVTDRSEMDDTDTLSVAVTVKNTGAMAGKALVQLYVAPPRQEVIRPVRELKGFEKVYLEPGELKTVNFKLSKRAFAHWSGDAGKNAGRPGIESDSSAVSGDWCVEPGAYRIQVCENAHKVLTETIVNVQSTQSLRWIKYSLDMTMGDFAKTPEGHKILDDNIGYMVQGMAAAGFLPGEAVGALNAMGGGKINLAAVEMLASRMGMDAGGAGGVSVLFGQPVSMLTSFMPEEKVQELKVLMAQWNGSDL